MIFIRKGTIETAKKMKLNPFDVDIQPEDLVTINTPDSFKSKIQTEDVRLSKDLPIVIKYDYVDLDKTDYHFHQEFTLRDTQEYFSKMKEISSNTINKLEDKASKEKDYHFYRSAFKGRVRENILKIMPDVDDSIIVYHFGLYECESKEAKRDTDERSPRIYFVLGYYGFIYILFFDPFHELNPTCLMK